MRTAVLLLFVIAPLCAFAADGSVSVGDSQIPNSFIYMVFTALGALGAAFFKWDGANRRLDRAERETLINNLVESVKAITKIAEKVDEHERACAARNQNLRDSRN